MSSKKKYRYWSFIVYPESCPDNWIDILQDTGLPIAISPLHNLDVDEEGVIKKSHYHCILCFQGPTTYNNVYELGQKVNSAPPLNIYSVKGQYEYLTHKNNPEKAQYNEFDIRTLNGFDIADYSVTTALELHELMSSIDDDILRFHITEYATLKFLYKEIDVTKYNFVNNHSVLYRAVFSSLRGSGGIDSVHKQVLDVIEKFDLEVLSDEV